MSKFDFRAFHLKAIHAETEEQKMAINQELKDIYVGLSDNDKKIFNDELQAFLVTQYKNLAEHAQAINAAPSAN